MTPAKICNTEWHKIRTASSTSVELYLAVASTTAGASSGGLLQKALLVVSATERYLIAAMVPEAVLPQDETKEMAVSQPAVAPANRNS